MRDALPDAGHRALLRIICIGNAWRSDDAAALEVARLLAGSLPDGVELVAREGEPLSLIDDWNGATSVWLVDAISSGGEPGTVHRFDASETELPAVLFRTSTHHVGLAETIEIARAVGRLPATTIVYGIEGGSFGVGNSLTPAVARAVDRVADALRADVRAV